MNAAFLILSSAALVGADPAPQSPATPVVVSGTGCSNCGTPAYSSYTTGCGGCKPSLLDKIKSKFSGFGKKSYGCGCAPAPVVAACDPCHAHPKGNFTRPNLYDTMKSRWGSGKCGPVCDPCGCTAVSGCASPLPVGAPPAPGTSTPPQKMPQPPAKTGGNTGSAPQPAPPVTGAGLSGTSPY